MSIANLVGKMGIILAVLCVINVLSFVALGYICIKLEDIYDKIKGDKK